MKAEHIFVKSEFLSFPSFLLSWRPSVGQILATKLTSPLQWCQIPEKKNRRNLSIWSINKVQGWYVELLLKLKASFWGLLGLIFDNYFIFRELKFSRLVIRTNFCNGTEMDRTIWNIGETGDIYSGEINMSY